MCEIWGSYGTDYEETYVLGCHFVIWQMLANILEDRTVLSLLAWLTFQP
jgi:hypothetical protein